MIRALALALIVLASPAQARLKIFLLPGPCLTSISALNGLHGIAHIDWLRSDHDLIMTDFVIWSLGRTLVERDEVVLIRFVDHSALFLSFYDGCATGVGQFGDRDKADRVVQILMGEGV